MMATLSKPDERDFTSLPPETLDWRLSPELRKGLRIGLCLDIGCGAAPDAAVRVAIERAARDFEAAGATVEPIGPMVSQDMLDGLDTFWRTRSLIDIDALTPDRREKMLPFIRVWAEGARGVSGEAVFRGFSRIPEFAERAVAATRRFDYVLTPTAPHVAFPAELASPSDDPANPFPHIGFTVAFNMSGQPAVSINAGFDEAGLPIGLQIVGRRFDDLGVLSLARAYETLRSAPERPWPEPPFK